MISPTATSNSELAASVPKLTAAPGPDSEARVASLPSSVSSWSVVSGQDWDQRMLFEALRQNQGVVMDQVLEASGDNTTSGPMALEDDVDLPDDFDIAEAMSLAPPEEQEEEEEARAGPELPRSTITTT